MFVTKFNPGRWRNAAAAAVAAAALAGSFAAAPARAAENPKIEQSALDLLKKTAETLKNAKSFSVDVFDMRQLPTDVGPSITLVNDLDFTVVRPDKLRVEGTVGDSDTVMVYDGKKLAIYDETKNVYLSVDAPGTLDELVDFAAKNHGLHFAIADFVLSDPYASLGKDVEVALDAGPTKLDGEDAEHLIFAKKNIEYEIWIDPETSLPKLFTVDYLDKGRSVHFLVSFEDWSVNIAPKADAFTFAAPEGATAIQFLPSDAN